MERRKNPRIACRIPCVLHAGRKPVQGVVRDLSATGLRVQAAIDPPEQGEPVSLTVSPPGRAAFPLECLAWHSRRVVQRSSGQRLVHLGLVLARASDAFFELVAFSSSPAPAPAPARARPSPGLQTVTPPDLRTFAVRVKQQGGPRSRRVVVGAADAREARERALGEIGSGWEIVEVKDVAPA